MTEYRQNNRYVPGARERAAQRRRRRYTDHSQFGGPVSERDEKQPVQGDYRPGYSAQASQYDRRHYVSESQFSRRSESSVSNQAAQSQAAPRGTVQDQSQISKQYRQGSAHPPVYDLNQGVQSHAKQVRQPKQNNPRTVRILAIVAAVLFAIILVRVVIALPAINEYFLLNSSISQQEQTLSEVNSKNQEIQDQINSWQTTIDAYNSKKK